MGNGSAIPLGAPETAEKVRKHVLELLCQKAGGGSWGFILRLQRASGLLLRYFSGVMRKWAEQVLGASVSGSRYWQGKQTLYKFLRENGWGTNCQRCDGSQQSHSPGACVQPSEQAQNRLTWYMYCWGL